MNQKRASSIAQFVVFSFIGVFMFFAQITIGDRHGIPIDLLTTMIIDGLGIISDYAALCARSFGDRVLDFFRATAKEHRCYLIYGAYRDLPGGGYANCSYLIGRDGEIVGIYDKNYPTIGDMEFGTRPGAEAPVFETDFGTIGIISCFDLNFDELLERYAAKKPDILAFSSYYHGGLMQGYWAYRCRAHFLGAAVGALESTVVSPVGEVLKKSTCYFRKFTTSINTNCAVVHLDGNWAKLQAAIDRYGTDITMSDPGNLGAVLLTVERPGLKVEEVLRKFSIERWDDYYQRSAAAREQALQQQPK